MITFLEKVIMWLLMPVAALMVLFVAFWLPIHLINQVDCLDQGYPETKTTILLESYCMTLDGSVTVKVNKLP